MPELVEVHTEELEVFIIESATYFAKYGQMGITNSVPYSWLELVRKDFPKFSTRALCTIEAIIQNAADEGYYFMQREEFQELGTMITEVIDARERERQPS